MPICQKRCVDIMDQFGNPTKKPRLDDDWGDGLEGNDDLWGQAELTAEEFDLLEVQASQKVQMTNSQEHAGHSRSPQQLNKTGPTKDLEVKKEQYALEGQVKLLSDSLDKTIRELTSERLNRDKIIAERLEEFKIERLGMKKEIDKLQTALEFKEQEIRAAAHNRSHFDMKGRDSPSQQHPDGSPSKRSSNTFLERFHFKRNSVASVESAVQTVEQQKEANHVLSLLSPQGKPTCSAVVSRLLYNRKDRNGNSSGMCSGLVLNSCSVPPMDRLLQAALPSVAWLNVSCNADEVWYSYETCLKQHLAFLQSAAKGQHSLLLKKIRPPAFNASLSARKHRSAFEEEIEKQHHAVILCLKDVNELIQFECPSVNSPQRGCLHEHNEQAAKLLSEAESVGGYSNPLFGDDEKMDISPQSPVCLASVFSLANPETYPSWYYHKQSEMEYALNVLVSWSSKSASSLTSSLHSLPLHTLISGQHGLRCASMVLQIVSNMLKMKSLGPFFHQMGSCLFSSVADLCHTASSSKRNEEHETILNLIQSFLCSSVAVSGARSIDNGSCLCSSQLTQSFIIMLWKHYEACCKDASQFQLNLLRKGVITLHQLSTHVKDFRDKRLPVEDHYISLICGISKLSKANACLESLSDSIHDLWDFQDDNVDEIEERISD